MYTTDVSQDIPHSKEAVLRSLQVKDYYKKELPSIKWNGKKGVALCPWHDDHRPSLSIDSETGDYHCFGCDEKGSIFDFHMKKHNLPFADALKELALLAGIREPSKKKIVEVYDYKDASGNLLHQTVRYKPKGFAQRRPDGNGGFIYNLQEITTVIYNLSEVNKAETVFVVEGERDCETLSSIGITATTNPMGAGKWNKSYNQYLAGKDVIILPDNDKVGHKHAEDVARSLSGIAKSLKIVNLPNLPDKGDVSDWLTRGETKENLLQLVSTTAEWDGIREITEPTSSKDFKRTDLGNAERFVHRYGDIIRFCPPRNKWLIWNGKYWQLDETNQIEVLGKKTVRGILDEAAKEEDESYKELLKHAARSESVSRIRAMIDLAKSEPGIPILPQEFDKDLWLLNVKNGTIDLRTGILRQPQKSDLITRIIDVEYYPDAECPTWHEFLHKVMDGNEGLIMFLQQAVGYSLTGDTREQCLFFLYGKGANGKSTFIEAITGLIGAYSKHTRPETFMAKKSDGVPNDLAELEGVRMVAAVELEEGRRIAEVLTKQVSGGDTLKARYLFQEFFEYKPQFKLWLCGNHKPRIRGTDHAIWRRIKLIPWTVTIPDHEQDKELPSKLKAELPGILAWAVRGCVEWQANGLSTPLEVQAATAGYRKEMDVLGDFFENCVIEGAAESVTIKELYEAYIKFSEDNGESPKERLGKKKFNERVADRGFDQYRAGRNILTWLGLGIREG